VENVSDLYFEMKDGLPVLHATLKSETELAYRAAINLCDMIENNDGQLMFRENVYRVN
jgi:hypothetical protein